MHLICRKNLKKMVIKKPKKFLACIINLINGLKIVFLRSLEGRENSRSFQRKLSGERDWWGMGAVRGQKRRGKGEGVHTPDPLHPECPSFCLLFMEVAQNMLLEFMA